MPLPNDFTNCGPSFNPAASMAAATLAPSCDGLNVAGYRWVRRVQGQDTSVGDGQDTNRDQYNARIDHNFNQNHKLSFSMTREKDWSMTTQTGIANWPRIRRPGKARSAFLFGIAGLHIVSGCYERIPVRDSKKQAFHLERDSEARRNRRRGEETASHQGRRAVLSDTRAVPGQLCPGRPDSRPDEPRLLSHGHTGMDQRKARV